ncbi:uncharacterized protein F4807DRAFT_443279 [Annulohypoxylon truncatum]|uniref:uncharacterized protein n=1 Tax=Annulohypoxylon truncatum TaxID=327061 RepID=UPI002008908B|nr:uncharacterized protein F4807DRAFT_443279 [Annulohypoxylon truncatum]KAI1205431.1 hypothetical protein F4807DRAFT_443279 [Annulohypoxylon truncatum]
MIFFWFRIVSFQSWSSSCCLFLWPRLASVRPYHLPRLPLLVASVRIFARLRFYLFACFLSNLSRARASTSDSSLGGFKIMDLS